MRKNRDKRKGSSFPSASHTSITLREENNGRKQNKGEEKGGSTNMKFMLKLQHLTSLAMWATQEATVPSLAAFFVHHLMACGDPDPLLFPCQRCETILLPGHNCTVRIESDSAQHRPKKSNASPQNNVIYWCYFCSHQNMKRGTPKGHMKEICPKVKPSLVSKHAKPIPRKAANPEIIPQNKVEVCKTDEIPSLVPSVDIPTADSPATPTIATDTPITNSPATPLVRTGNTLVEGKRRKRNKPAPTKEAEPESNPASAGTQNSVSSSNKCRRKSWTSLREIAESSDQDMQKLLM